VLATNHEMRSLAKKLGFSIKLDEEEPSMERIVLHL